MSIYDAYQFVDREVKFRGFQKLLQPTTRQAVMLVEAPQDMGKTWLISRMQHHCQTSTVKIPAARIDFRNPRQVHAVQDYLGLIRFVRDQLGQPSLFTNLNVTINSFSETEAGIHSGLPSLRQRIEAHFDLEELKSLVFDLGINFENLAGDTLRAKSRELVNYCQRHHSLRLLVETCALLRTGIDWWHGLEKLRLAQVALAAADEVEKAVDDNDAPVWADSEVERRRAERQINNAFFECLSSLLAESGQAVLLFDSYERVPSEIDLWIRDELLPRIRDGKLSTIKLVITGRRTPDLTDLGMSQLLVQTGLDPFTEAHIQEYFEDRRQIKGLDMRTIMLTSGGVPGAMAMMADHAMATTSADDDFFNDL